VTRTSKTLGFDDTTEVESAPEGPHIQGGSFTPEEADAIVSSAVHSDIGKPGFVPPECQ